MPQTPTARYLNLSWTEIRYDDETRSLEQLRRRFAAAKVDWWAPETNAWPR